MVKNYPKNGSWNALINGSSRKKGPRNGQRSI